MKSYSQNREDLFIANYFGSHIGTLCEIGANDGVTLSNSLFLIEKGWTAHLVEPGRVFGKLAALYANNSKVTCYNFGIGERDEVVNFYESGAHVPNGKDIALVSSVDYSETERWRNSGVDFFEHNVQLVSWETFTGNRNKFDYISIDAEGYDWTILQQIGLTDVKCICIEWNSKPELLKLFSDYCTGFKIAVKNAENLIFVR